MLEIGATAIDALAAASEDKEEAMQKFAKSATAYYELLKVGSILLVMASLSYASGFHNCWAHKVISLALRAKIDQVLEMGIMPQITGQPNVPFRPNLYGEEKDLELRAKAVFVLRKELEKMIETLEAGVSWDAQTVDILDLLTCEP